MAWLDTIQAIGLAGLAIGTVVLGVTIWRQSHREARHAATLNAQRYTRFLRFLADVRDARR